MNKIEKINKLKEVLEKLKTEFVGLDNIIDEIGKSIFPWYVTPEVNNRPIVVSLWGMTGTGKTSVITRLLELLDLSSKTLNFDCGSESGDVSERSIVSKINEYLCSEDISVSMNNFSRDMVFIFDEFQHARTITEDGSEQKNQGIQPVWTLIDSGKINLNEAGDWHTSTVLNFIEDLRNYLEDTPRASQFKLDEGFLSGKEIVKDYLESMAITNYDRNIPGVTSIEDRPYSKLKRNINGAEDPYRPLYIFSDEVRRTIVTELRKSSGISKKEIIKKMHSIKSLGEMMAFLEDTKKVILTPKIIDCSKSLVFILGNLDEAFTVGRDVSPDMDADIFYDETNKVTIGDIKNALKERFRPEQIARFGNTIIKYPTLKKKHFKEIIRKEVNRITSEFKKNFSIEVSTTETFNDLLYSESVFPSQGVRPVFTTINTMFNSLLSDVLVHIDNKEGDYNVVVDVKTKDFKVPEIKILLNINNEETIEKNIKLTLGADRCPKLRKTRFINGIHEAGHAILLSYLTGKLPLSIVAVSSDHGGFCVTYDKDSANEIDRKLDVDNSVMISLGGWCAEKLLFEKDKCLLGSSSDISDAWDTLSSAYYKGGYERFISYSSKYSHDSLGVATGVNDSSISELIEMRFKRLSIDTTRILDENKRLLLETGKLLGNEGEISGEKFMSLIKSYGETLTEDYMSKIKKDLSYDYYENVIEDALLRI